MSVQFGGFRVWGFGSGTHAGLDVRCIILARCFCNLYSRLSNAWFDVFRTDQFLATHLGGRAQPLIEPKGSSINVISQGH